MSPHLSSLLPDFSREIILDLSTGSGMHAVIVSRLAPTTLQVISSGSIRPSYNKLADPISHYMRPAQPATVIQRTPRPSSDRFKVHRFLPAGRLPSSRCIRSALSKIMQLRTLA